MLDTLVAQSCEDNCYKILKTWGSEFLYFTLWAASTSASFFLRASSSAAFHAPSNLSNDGPFVAGLSTTGLSLAHEPTSLSLLDTTCPRKTLRKEKFTIGTENSFLSEGCIQRSQIQGEIYDTVAGLKYNNAIDQVEPTERSSLQSHLELGLPSS